MTNLFLAAIDMKQSQFVLGGIHAKLSALKSRVKMMEEVNEKFAQNKTLTPFEEILFELETEERVTSTDKSALVQIYMQTPTPEEHAISSKICSETIKRARDAIENELKLTEAAMDAKKAMEFAVSVWKKDAVEFMNTSDEILKQFRQTRMAMDMETSKIKTSIGDILSILGDPSMAKKMEAVSSLIAATEKLKALKDSGFLDAMVDTLIKANELAAKSSEQGSLSN